MRVQILESSALGSCHNIVTAVLLHKITLAHSYANFYANTQRSFRQVVPRNARIIIFNRKSEVIAVGLIKIKVMRNEVLTA
jgi:hypothetical protein